MAKQSSAQPAATLRALTYRLSSTPTKQLPNVAPQIAACLWNCKNVLSISPEATATSTETNTAVHRFRTSLSSLLQDRTVEGRWAAVVLTKAAIEAGGVEMLSKSNVWIRSLLAILKKPDPPTTKKLAILSLTRIFMLTWDYSNLVREITTPAVPGFISACLQVESSKSCSAGELQTVLEAFATLMPRHHTIFRTNEGHIRTLLLKILSSSLSNTDADDVLYYTEAHKATARRVFVLLHHCTPKQAGGEKWDETLKATIAAAHGTCDRVFRSVIEDWRPAAGTGPASKAAIISSGPPEQGAVDAVGMTGWSGVYAGSERLIEVIRLAESHFKVATSATVPVRVGLVADLLTRVLSVTQPSSSGGKAFKLNEQIPKDEREAMFGSLPEIHVAALGLLQVVQQRLGNAAISVMQPMLELVGDMFFTEHSNVAVRVATYRTIEVLLRLVGPSLPKDDFVEIAPIFKASCGDLLPPDSRGKDMTSTKVHDKSQNLSNGDSTLSSQKIQSSHPTVLGDLHTAASSLLPVLFSSIYPPHIPRKLRVQMERTAVITRHKEALVAAVLNPTSKTTGASFQPSLLPILAQMFPHAPEVEALLRPRMPPIVQKAPKTDDMPEESDIDEELEDASDEEMMDQDHDPDQPATESSTNFEVNTRPPTATQASEDLHFATPPETLSPAATNNSTSTATQSAKNEHPPAKRPVAELDEAATSAKRFRASPVAEALAPEPAITIPGPDPVTAQAAVPKAVEVGQAGSAQVATMPAPVAAEGGNSDDDLGSDFEMPPLTMEPDTDPEDDD